MGQSLLKKFSEDELKHIESFSLESVDHEIIGEKKIFLGGTCVSNWRDTLIKMLEIGYYDPVSENWTPKMKKDELDQRDDCEFLLYVITPKMTGVYSIAEVIDDSNNRTVKTILCILSKDDDDEWDEGQKLSLNSVEKMVIENGCKTFRSLKQVADYVNSKASIKK